MANIDKLITGDNEVVQYIMSQFAFHQEHMPLTPSRKIKRNHRQNARQARKITRNRRK